MNGKRSKEIATEARANTKAHSEYRKFKKMLKRKFNALPWTRRHVWEIAIA